MHKVVSGILERILPRWAYHAIRRVRAIILVPVRFSRYTSNVRSSLKGRPYDRSGQPIFWYSQSAVDFLRNIDHSGRTILEFGAGHSTIWWARHAESVVSFEDDQQWHDYILRFTLGNVELHLTELDVPNAKEILGDRKFDVIVVDGMNRPKCAELALDHVTDDGAIIIDNADLRNSNGPMDTAEPTLKRYRELGLNRVDFHGFATCKVDPQCTSIYFKDKCYLFEGKHDPVSIARQ